MPGPSPGCPTRRCSLSPFGLGLAGVAWATMLLLVWRGGWRPTVLLSRASQWRTHTRHSVPRHAPDGRHETWGAVTAPRPAESQLHPAGLFPAAVATDQVPPTGHRWLLLCSAPLLLLAGVGAWLGRRNAGEGSTSVSCASVAGTTAVVDIAGKEWDLHGLKREVDRQVQRCLKKTVKAKERHSQVQFKVEQLLSNPAASPAELDAAPDVDGLQAELDALQERLRRLQALEAGLQGVKGAVPPALIDQAVALEVNDHPPERPPRNPPKPKGPKVEPRKPYWVYMSQDAIEIRVGRSASDNDVLSLSPEHRDGADWWMHASGSPGSHVVVRCHDNSLPPETVKDAAVLAAAKSKAGGSNVKVTLTRCRHVSKPPGAKPGLVRLNGAVQTVAVDLRAEAARLQRLESTKGQ